LNIVRQIGASVATALFAVVLQRGIVENTHSHSSSDSALLSETVKLPPAIAEDVARAFAHTFWWAVATIVLAFVPTLFLPSRGAGATPGTPPVTEADAPSELPVGAVE
jgi:hypothetical protein